MPRKLLIRNSKFPYHITSRSNNKEWFYIPIEETWKIFTKNLINSKKIFDLNIHCFVLMNNHFHLMIKTPQSNIDKVMHWFIHRTSLDIGKAAKRVNRIFGGRYKWSLIQSEKYFHTVYRYIYQNPLRANMCSKIQYYSFHSMAKQLQGSNLYDDTLEVGHFNFKNISEKLDWLNEGISDITANERIAKGLKKTIYSPVFSRSY